MIKNSAPDIWAEMTLLLWTGIRSGQSYIQRQITAFWHCRWEVMMVRERKMGRENELKRIWKLRRARGKREGNQPDNATNLGQVMKLDLGNMGKSPINTTHIHIHTLIYTTSIPSHLLSQELLESLMLDTDIPNTLQPLPPLLLLL